MEGREQDDGREARDRALRAMVEAEDEATRVSLWRLALRYNSKASDARGGDFARALSW